ncbi:hypothetical protein [Candidatus Nitrosacidococcus tergens]|uniref:hypothetical protein n=1 Tax=Candidatus Nitrosacidococcus tergens TaxID=553981 RepID=UPI0018D6AFE0|nr:hypothetical protein [Candidatus Nitrosacidococcus tergens]
MFDAAVQTVEQAFDLVEEVFKAVSVGFEELYRWLGFIFNWQDILRTHEVIKYSINEVSKFVPTVLTTLQEQISEYIKAIDGQVKDTFQQAIKGIGKSSILGIQQSIQQKYVPTQPDQMTVMMAMDHNIVWNGLMNNMTNSPSMPGGSVNLSAIRPEARAAAANLMELLEQSAGDFQSSDAFNQAKDYLSRAMTAGGPDQFVSNTLAGLLSVVEGVVVWSLDVAANTIVTAIFNAARSLIAELNLMLNQEWNIPFVSDLYLKVTGGSTLTALDLGALLLAVPTTVIYKGIFKVAPFPDTESIASFKAFFNVDTLHQSSGLKSSQQTHAQLLQATQSANLEDWRKTGAQIFTILGYIADIGYAGCRTLLDANDANPLSNSNPLSKQRSERFSKAMSTYAITFKFVGQAFKIPWPWSTEFISCDREGFENIIWIYELLPLIVEASFFFSEDEFDDEQRNSRIARASGDRGAVIASIFGAVEAVLLIIKNIKSGCNSIKIASDMMLCIPEVLTFCKISSLNEIFKNVPFVILVVADGISFIGLLLGFAVDMGGSRPKDFNTSR